MTHRILISHSHDDRDAASIIAEAIRRVTLGQVAPWFSSDDSSSGGVRPGELWVTTILDRLNASDCVIAVLTPHSVSQPWLYFECGYVVSREGREVIPVCVGIDGANDVPFPLAMYQSFSLVDVARSMTFLKKLAARFAVEFDEEMARPVVESMVRKLAGLPTETRTPGEPLLSAASLVAEIKDHIDRRLLQLTEARQDSASAAPRRKPEAPAAANYRYSVPLHIRFPDFEELMAIVIESASTTIQNVLDNVYFALQRRVKPYRYLVEWALLSSDRADAAPHQPLITRGIADALPAQLVFLPGTHWSAVPLAAPFRAGEELKIAAGLPEPLKGP